MKYIISFYEIDNFLGIKTPDMNGEFAAIINSFNAFSNENDELLIILSKYKIENKLRKQIESIDFISLIDIEQYKQKFLKWITKNNRFPLQDNIFLGIPFTSWFAKKYIKNEYFLLENDIFINDELHEKFSLNFTDNKITLLQASFNSKNKVYTNSLIYHVPAALVGKIANIQRKSYWKSGKGDSNFFWNGFEDLINKNIDLFKVDGIMKFWKDSDSNTKIIHRNKAIMDKEFRKSDIDRDNQIFQRAEYNKWIKYENISSEWMLHSSKMYRKQLENVCRQYGFTLPEDNRKYLKRLENLKKNLDSLKENN